MSNPSDKERPEGQNPGEEYDPNQYNISESDLEIRAMDDKLNIKRITFWAVLGIVIFAVLLGGVYFLYNYNKFVTTQEASMGSEHEQITRMKQESQEHLNSFGVIDEEEGRYHIPVDSAMTIYLETRD